MPFQLLAQSNFWRLWVSGALVGTMRWLDVLVVGIYVLEVSGSAFQVALAMFIRMAPMFVLGSVAGAYAETVDKRKLLILIFLGMAVTYFVIFTLAFFNTLSFWHLLVGVFYSGLIRTVDMPIRRAMIAETTKMAHISAAMGLDTSTNNFTRMLGPFLGGFVYAFLGLDGAMMAGGLLHLAAAFYLLGVDVGRKPDAVQVPSTFSNVVEGFQYVRANSMLKAIMVMTVAMNFFGFSHISLAPVITHQELALSPEMTGVILSLEGGGAFLGAILISFFATDRWTGRLFFGGGLLYLAGVAVFALSGGVAVAAFGLLAAGFGMAGFGVLQWSLVIAHTPPEMRTRVMGTLTMCIGVAPFGILLAGYMAERLDAAMAVLLMAAAGAVAVLLTGLLWPGMLRARTLAK